MLTPVAELYDEIVQFLQHKLSSLVDLFETPDFELKLSYLANIQGEAVFETFTKSLILGSK